MIVNLNYDSGTNIQTTGTHPFFMENRDGWVDAAALRAGDDSLLASEVAADIYGGIRKENVSFVKDRKGIIRSVSHDIRTETVYNFEVEGTHTYLVTEDDVVVHNQTPGYSSMDLGGIQLLTDAFLMTRMGNKVKTFLQKDLPRTVANQLNPKLKSLNDQEYQSYLEWRQEYIKSFADSNKAIAIMGSGFLCGATMGVTCDMTAAAAYRKEIEERTDLTEPQKLALLDAFDYYYTPGFLASLLNPGKGPNSGKINLEPVPVGPRIPGGAGTPGSVTGTIPFPPNVITMGDGDNSAGQGERKNEISARRASDTELKKNNIDAHELKYEFLGKKAPISQYDIYIDKKSGELLIYRKGMVGNPIRTGEFLSGSN